LEKYTLKPTTRLALLKGLADIEYGISKGGNDSIQSTAVIGCIKNAMECEAK
jgi:replication factor C subunit 3/5